ncbi:MAG TPA: AgmX/PglI C-terminal domain-containing protein [Polyangiaceae bacterium]|nr:AgmX/PglI C-terminal domain-containing protein [Polyangiaceae bacterium]
MGSAPVNQAAAQGKMRGALGAGLLLGSALAACASSPARPAGPPGIPPAVTLTATPIAPVESASPAPSSEPAASAEPAPAPTQDLAPLPPPAPEPAGPPPPSRILMADSMPHFLAHLRAKDTDKRRAQSRDDSHESPRDATRETRETRDGRHKRPYHPAPGIVVDVTDAQGGISAADLQRIARNAEYWPFRECYEEGLRGDQRLAGKVSLEIAVNPSGGVDHSTITSSTVRDEIASACVAREAHHLTLPPAPAATTAKIDVSLATGDEPVPTARPFPNADALRQALRKPWEAARQCYATGLEHHPDIGGRLELRFRVHHTGEIFEIAENDDHDVRFEDVDVTRCVLGVYRSAKLPNLAHAPRERQFVYAIHFEAKPDEPVAP